MTEDKEILDAFRQEGKEDYAFNLLVRRYSRDLYQPPGAPVFPRPLLADPQDGPGP